MALFSGPYKVVVINRELGPSGFKKRANVIDITLRALPGLLGGPNYLIAVLVSASKKIALTVY
jgi:hypothetical protein